MYRGLVLAALVGCGRWGFAPERDVADASADAPADVPPDVAALGPCTKLGISDDFNDGGAGPIWTQVINNPVTVAETSGMLQVTLASAGGAHYGGYDSTAVYDLRDHCMFVSFVGPPANEPMVEMTFTARNGTSNAGWVYHQGLLEAFVNTGTFTATGTVTYDAAMHVVLRIRDDAGVMTWETSPDGVAFNALASQPTPFDVGAIKVVLEAGTYGSAQNPGTAAYDNFNTP